MLEYRVLYLLNNQPPSLNPFEVFDLIVFRNFVYSSPQPQSWMPVGGDLGAEPNLLLCQPSESPIPEESDNFAEDFPDFPRYNSDDIVYEEPQRQAKIVGGRYLKGDLLGVGAYSKVREMLDCVTLCRRAVKIMKQRRLSRIPNGEENVRRLEKKKVCV